MSVDIQLVIRHIELLIGSIGTTFAVFFAVFLLLPRYRRLQANLFLAIYLLAFALRIGKTLFFNYFFIDPSIRNIFLAMLLAIGPSLWLYVKYRSSPRSAIPVRVFWHYLPFFLFMAFSWIIPNNFSRTSLSIATGLLLHILTYSSYAFYALLTRPISPTIYQSGGVRKWLLYMVRVTMVMTLIYLGILFGYIPYLGGAFLFSAVVISLAIWGLNHPFLFKLEAEKYANTNLTDGEVNSWMARLITLMEQEKPYLNPELTLTELSKKLGLGSKQLSQVINQSQQENFSQYVARYRVEEAKRLLAAAAYRHYKISVIAYESGFNSISSFNAAFKKITSITAVAYRQSLCS